MAIFLRDEKETKIRWSGYLRARLRKAVVKVFACGGKHRSCDLVSAFLYHDSIELLPQHHWVSGSDSVRNWRGCSLAMHVSFHVPEYITDG